MADKREWLQKNGFNDAETTFVYFPSNSYEVKEELKKADFRFSQYLLWHAAAAPEGYAESCIEVPLDKVAEASAWGECFYKPEVRTVIDELVRNARPKEENSSRWVGEIKDKFTDISVTLVKVHGFNSQFGFSQVVVFKTEEGNLLKWFTKVDIPYEVNERLLLSGTIKDHVNDKYDNDAEVTIVTRCKMR